MSSIILSFIGNQDPISSHTNEEGSLVTLVRHLIEQNITISYLILLHTTSTQTGAELTREWLHEYLEMPLEIINLEPVSDTLSKDPVDLLFAVQSARQAIENAKSLLKHGDILEFNASSGTPVMKSAWSILQAAGYAPHSRVWQVRNPKEMQVNQARVFTTNLATLKNEFDLQIIKQQIQDYNYSGALATLQKCEFCTDRINALVNSANHRLAFDFNRAFSSLSPFKQPLDETWLKEISALRSRKKEAILKEAYWKALIKLTNQEYADFLVLISSLQEGVMGFLVERKLPLNYPKERYQTSKFWEEVKSFQSGKLYKHLENYRLPRGDKLDLKGFMTRPTQIACLEFFSDYSNVLKSLEELNRYSESRNQWVHKLEGVSEIQDSDKVKANLRQILEPITSLPSRHPFDVFNQQIFVELQSCL